MTLFVNNLACFLLLFVENFVLVIVIMFICVRSLSKKLMRTVLVHGSSNITIFLQASMLLN